LNDQIKKTEMDRVACMEGGGGGEAHIGFWWGKLREGIHLEERSVNERITLKQRSWM
jgi:hypothetical protein